MAGQQPIPTSTNGMVYAGTFWYRDVFNKREHWVQFCFQGYRVPCSQGMHDKADIGEYSNR